MRERHASEIAEQKQQWLPLFHEYIAHMRISSKEIADPSLRLGDILYSCQTRFLAEICDGLDDGIRDFKCLKCRQMGISTISLAMDVFWLSVFDGMQGALITDDESNREKFRALLMLYIESLPKDLRVGIKKHNRHMLELRNGSILDYLVAGKKRTNTTLGTSRALNFVHGTEVSAWGSPEGLANLKASLAQKHPNRLYLWESTARGMNMWRDMCEEAQDDPHTQKFFFLGWYLKEDYSIPRHDPRFDAYWDGTLADEEIALCEQVEALYGVEITPEQIAWYRWYGATQSTDEDGMKQNYPWTADQAFVLTGKSFFPLRRIGDDMKFLREIKAPFKGYRYEMGENFLATEIVPVDRVAEADLKIWEEPHINGVYTMGVDPSYGRSDNKDRHSIEVVRCYADRVVQVAEYATPDHDTYQLTWVMAHLAGAYKNCWINVEVNGPGAAIMDELRHLKQLLDNGYLTERAEKQGMVDLFSAVKWYLWHRPDSLGAGYCRGWKTNADNKLAMLNQMRDNYALGLLKVRSLALLDEMQHTVQDGSEIEGSGRHKDDRVFAIGLANRAYIDWVRGGLIANAQTFEAVCRQEEIENAQPGATMLSSIITSFFRQAEAMREERGL